MVDRLLGRNKGPHEPKKDLQVATSIENDENATRISARFFKSFFNTG